MSFPAAVEAVRMTGVAGAARRIGAGEAGEAARMTGTHQQAGRRIHPMAGRRIRQAAGRSPFAGHTPAVAGSHPRECRTMGPLSR